MSALAAAFVLGLASAPLAGGTTLPYFVSAPPGAETASALIAIHGYPRDARRTFDAAAKAADAAGAPATLIVSPIFQVPAAEAARSCHSKGVPEAAPGNALWHCNDWSDGAPALNDRAVTSFGAMDRLVATLVHRYPQLHSITIAGFSAGAQFVQHYAGFAAAAPDGVHLRFVVADPSAFLYFDPVRPVGGTAACPAYNHWKLGTEDLPAYLGRTAAEARAAYAAADIAYLEGADDTGTGRGTAYKLLEKKCGAERQGQFRLDRGENYAAYDRAHLALGRHRLTIVPGCAHKVTCVFPAEAARAALFGGAGSGR